MEFIPEVLITPRPENLATLTRQIAASKYELDKLMEENLNRREQLIEEIREHNDETLLKTLLLGVVGITLFGVATGIFFLQLTSDLRRLNRRVAEVVSGYRGPMLSTDRKDEVGELIRGVNEMTDTLMVRERELEIERRKHSHLEKMEAIEHLIGGIAHEINNPVSAIDGLARLVLKNQQDCKCEDSESHNESRRLEKSNLEEILRYSSNLTRTMRDLHVLAATGGDRYELFDFNQLVSQTCGILKLGSISELIHLDLKLDPHSPAFYGIKEQMGLVISAILDNAIHAVGDSGINQPRIIVTTSVAADSLICQITDNGSGIAPDILKHLFESSLTVRSSEGPTGLGLPICQSIITSLRGTIELESEIGQGTTVTVKLPIHTDSDIALAVGDAS